MSGTVRLDAPVSAGVLFDYLTDTHRRPEWQSSLRAVADVQGTGGTGTTWTDVTAVGARPQLRVTEAERPRLWSEVGHWQGLTAELRLDLIEYAPARTRVDATFRITGVGVFAAAAAVLQHLAGPAIKADLQRAVRLAAEG